MTDGHCFISYSTADALDFARRLADELQGGEDTFIKTWFDKRDIDPARNWDDQIVEGIRSCKCMLFVMTKDSTSQGSMCKNEWNWALKYKKPVVPILLQKGVEQPFGLGNRQWIDFTGEFEHGLSKLRLFLRDMDLPKGVLQSLKDRHADAERDLRRAKPEDQPRIQAEIEELNKQIEIQQKIVADPKAAQEQTQKNIEAGLERERQPEKPVASKTSTKFINPPPGIAPNYFQDRTLETHEVVKFLQDDSQRLMTIVGRGGVGKTAMVCRLLKGLEAGELPDGLGNMRVEGIVYLSESGSHRVNFANLFYDLCKLLPSETSQELDAVYKNPQGSTESKMRALLEKFTGERVVLLLDNFEPLVDTETFAIRDAELDESLRAFLNGTHTAVNIVLTTRVAPKPLNLIQPGRQRVLTLDEGLESPYAENILREMDSDGRMGLKSAPADLLSRARERTRGYPRALEALFAILASDRYTTLEELLAMPTPENVVEALVGEAFNRLDTNAQKVMQALAVYNRPVTPAAVDFLLAPHIPAMDSAPILQRLANMHFARKESGRFYLHPVDKEYALSLISQKDLTIDRQDTQQLRYMIKTQTSIETVLRKYRKKLKRNFFDNLAISYFSWGERGLRILRFNAKRFSSFTLYSLEQRAADFFAQARKPHEQWEKLDDIAAHLAEFELRCAAGDYDTAVIVLKEIDFDYLFLWGHYQLLIDLHLRIKDKITDKNSLMFNFNGLGLAYRNIGKIKESITLFEAGLSKAREVKNRGWEDVFLGNLGSAYGALGDPHKAIEYCEQALVVARDVGDKRNEGVQISYLGWAYDALGDHHKGIEYYEQALGIAREIGDKQLEGAQLGNLGIVYGVLDDAHKAIEYYEQALVIAREISDIKSEEVQLGALGTAYATLGDAHKAIECYEQALGIAREIGDRNGEGLWLNSLGDTYVDLEDAQNAIKYCEQALVIYRETGVRGGEGVVLNTLGNAYAQLGDIRKAIEFYKQALVIYHEIGNRDLEGDVLNILGNAYAELEDVLKAIEYYEQGLNIFREIGDRQNEENNLGSLGYHYANLGDVYKAIEYQEQALVIAREIGNRQDESICIENIGYAFLCLNEYQKAEENIRKAIRIADEISFPIVQQNARDGLAENYLFQNDLVNARATIEAALQYDVPQNNHNATALHGIILLRDLTGFTESLTGGATRGENLSGLAIQAFTRAIAQADEILAKTPEYYSALDAKGLSICGLTICSEDGGRKTVDGGRETTVNGQSSMVYRQQAIETFRAARKIAPHAGVVKSVLRLFDELMKCDGGEILKDVRKAVEGKE